MDNYNEGKKAEIKEAILGLQELCENYADESYLFDYEKILGSIKEATTALEESVRCKRPEQLTEGVAWSENLYDAEEDFNPFVYQGDMSLQEFRQVQNADLDNYLEI